MHPGSFRGADREQGLRQTAAAIAASAHKLDLAKGGLTILIENSAGAEYSLGGSFEQVAEVLALSAAMLFPAQPALIPVIHMLPGMTLSARPA